MRRRDTGPAAARRTRLFHRVATAAMALALLAPMPAAAHKVIASVFASGAAIEGEVGFSNGDMAVGQVVEVFDETGTRLGEATTDAEGFFLFSPDRPVTHVFHADLGAGHVAEAIMPAEEVAAILGKQGATAPVIGAAAAAPATPGAAATIAYGAGSPAAPAALSEEAQAAIARIVRDETRPLRREIASYKEKNDLQSILGGLGYIAGLFGLGFYIAARRKLRDAA